MSHNVPSQYIKECKINNVFYGRIRAGGQHDKRINKTIRHWSYFSLFYNGGVVDISIIIDNHNNTACQYQ